MRSNILARLPAWAVLAGPALALALTLILGAGTGSGAASLRAAAGQPQVRAIPPNKVNELDCNGWSPRYKPVSLKLRGLCADPHGAYFADTGDSSRPGKPKPYWHRAEDNGHYIGHDEPGVKFISSAPGSGNTMTYFMQLPRDPARPPTNNGKVVDYAELSPAPWFGMPLCDPQSYPQNPCTPDSDANSGSFTDPSSAGSAFLELQFYAPHFPGLDSYGCDTTKDKWCAALTIDSIESKFNFADLNVNCFEPVNFAYLQTNGVPTGPPSPQLATIGSFIPNKHTLMLNPGDVLKVAITDPPAGLTTRVTDLTTHQSGFMTASAANGFMDTNYKTCAGTPFTFHAEYATAAPQNRAAWGALDDGIMMDTELGHSEVCTSLANHVIHHQPGFTSYHLYDTCIGDGDGGPSARGEGPCKRTTLTCHHAMTEGTSEPIKCPSENILSDQECEFSDGFCLPQGNRGAIQDGHHVVYRSPVNICLEDRSENGDIDYDGMSYQRTTWPDGSPNVPTSFRYAGPFDQSGQPYPKVQFETDLGGSEFLCNFLDGFNCTVPPMDARFYPFWSITNKKGQDVGHGLFPVHACTWNFGNVIKGVTTRAFGKDAEYGAPELTQYPGNSISAVLPNPELSPAQGCSPLTMPAT
jgi:hypothetical protein